ncbi:MAG: transglutaminase family protein [Chloroflexales bacterium]|nr:transglutaminase family protein [Chloroflexales bacterium]
MQIQIGFELVLESGSPTPTAAITEPPSRDGQRILTPCLTLTPQLPLRSYFDSFGNIVWRWTAPTGMLRVHYDAVAEVWPRLDPVYPDLPGTPVDQLPDSVLMYTLPSRYCPSDLARDDAWRIFGEVPDGWVRVQAICDWVHRNIVYAVGSSTGTTSGYEAYQRRQGVCRDFAHIAVMFCRALNIPARYVYGYLPDIDINGPANPDPMDFHAWFEAYLGRAWQTFDARHNRPRSGRVVIARGRDAVDTAILTSYGDSRLTGLTVWAHALPTSGLLSEQEAQL